MFARRFLLPISVPSCLLLSTLAFANEEKVKATFDRAVSLDGDAYVVARDLLESQGKSILPLLEEQAKSSNWRACYLAEALRQRIVDPHRATSLRWALLDGSEPLQPADARPVGGAKPTTQPTDQGRLVTALSEQMVKVAAARGDKVTAGRVVIDQQAIPVIIECFREFSGGGAFSRSVTFHRRAMFTLRHFRDARTAAPILHYFAQRNAGEETIKTLAALGKATLPVLHTALQDIDKPWPQPNRVLLAAKVLARIGNDTSAELLVEAFSKAPTSTAYTTLPILCDAIVQLKATNGPAALFHQLQRLAFDRKNDLDVATYLAVRLSLLKFGENIVPVLEEYTTPDTSIARRVVAASILYERKHPNELQTFYRAAGREFVTLFPRRSDVPARSGTPEALRGDEQGSEQLVKLGRQHGWLRSLSRRLPSLGTKPPIPLLLEAAAVARNEQLVNRLSQLPNNEQAFELLTWLLLSNQQQPLAWRGAIPALAAVGGTQAIDVYRRFEQKRPMIEIQKLVEAIIRIADPQGVTFLDDLLRHERLPQKATIQKIAAVLKQNPPRLDKLLRLDEADYRMAAARALAARGDPRSIPVLFEAADSEVADSEVAAQDAIVQIGNPAIAVIDEAAKASKIKHAALLAEVLKLRVRRPNLARKHRQAMNRQWPGFNYHVGPDVVAFKSAGQQVAKILGRDGVPLLEATIVWSSPSFAANVAAFSLAEFRQDRSLAIIREHAGNFGHTRSTSIAAEIFKAFGDKGIAAAKQIPAPNPGRGGFASRRGRHRAAMSTLAAVGDEQGVVGILDGLKLAASGKISASKTNLYLRLAAKYKNHRLVSGILAAIDRYGDGVASEALTALAAYNDPQLTDVHLRFLGHRYASDEALLGLARLQGDNTIAELLDHLNASEDALAKLATLRALTQFSSSDIWLARAKINRKNIEGQVPEIRDAFIAHLKADDIAVQTQAAESLSKLMQGRGDSKVTEVLRDWVAATEVTPPETLKYLSSTDDPDVAPLLLKLYRKDRLKRTHLAHHLVNLKYDVIQDDLVAVLRQRLASTAPKQYAWHAPEISALANLGATGREALLRLATDATISASTNFQVAVYRTLAQPHSKTFGPAAKLFQELVQNGAWEPRLRLSRYNGRSQSYQFQVRQLAETIAAIDPVRAYPILSKAVLEIGDESLRRSLANQLITLRRNKPEVQQVTVPLLSSTPTVAKDFPLRVACDLWLEAGVSRDDNLAPETRKRMMATGNDVLLVGVELFYDFPVPGKSEMARAVANLTHANDIIRRRSAAKLAVRKYPRALLDETLVNASEENRQIGAAIRQWRQQSGRILDVNPRSRGGFTNLLLVDWPIERIRRFTIAHLDLLAKVPNEAYMWSEKPLFPLLLSVRYSRQKSERQLLDGFVQQASPVAKRIAISVNQRGFGGFYGTNVRRWGPLPSTLTTDTPGN